MGIQKRQDRCRMIAKSLLYLQSKIELADLNKSEYVWYCCGSCRCMHCYSVATMENNNLEQRYAIKFCVELGEGVTDTYEKVWKAFGNYSVPRTQVFRWHKDFVNGRETVEGELRSVSPSSVRSTNVDHVRAFIRQDRLLTIRMIADKLNINGCKVHQVVTRDLNMRKVCAKIVPKNSNDDQKARRN
jgi:hypothetical protein